MIPDEAVEAAHPPEVQALYALCYHLPMDHGCKACKFRQQAAVAYIVNMCNGAIESLGDNE